MTTKAEPWQIVLMLFNIDVIFAHFILLFSCFDIIAAYGLIKLCKKGGGSALWALRVLKFGSANGQSIKRKALLNSRCPLRGHRVYEVKNDNVAPFLLYAEPTLPDLAILCRIAT